LATQDDRQEIDLQAGDNADIKVLRDVHGDVYIGTRPDRLIDQSDLRPGRSPGEIERTAELAQLDGWRQEQGDRWAVIVGPGGAGKSTLASQWFDRSQSAQSWAGRLWTDLGRGQGFAEVARRVIVHFGVASQERAERLDEVALVTDLVKALGEQPLLWVLDNLETVLESGKLPADYQAFWQQWWKQSSGAGWVLFTSRDLPAGMAERRLDLAEGFDPFQGASFLRARRIRGAEADLQAFSERVHGYPLILGLAAGFLKMEQGDDPHISKLPADFFTITAPHRDDPQATLETVLQWSFERLSPELRDWLGRLCVLRVAFAFELEDYPNLLPELAGRSFLIQDCLPLTDPDAPRQFVYRWQPIVQQFVQRQQPDLIEAHQFALNYFLLQAVEIDDCQTNNDICNYIESNFHIYSISKIQEKPELKISALLNMSIAYSRLMQYKVAIKLCQKSLLIARRIGSNHQKIRCLTNLGINHGSLGNHAKAILMHQKALEISQSIQDKDQEFLCRMNLGICFCNLGEYQKSFAFHYELWRNSRKNNNLKQKAQILGNLAILALHTEKYKVSIRLYSRAIRIFRKINDLNGELISLKNMGIAYEKIQEYEHAVDSYQCALKIVSSIGHPKEKANLLRYLGSSYHSLHQYQRAINFYNQSLDVNYTIKDQLGEAASLDKRGLALKQLGCLAEAQIDFAMARDLFRQLGQHHYAEIAEQNYQRVTQALQTSPSIPTLKPRSPWWVRLWRAWRRWLHRLFDRP